MPRYGASSAEWWAFAHELGLCADILPVVSNPHAILSARSTLKALGKTPSKYNEQREIVGIAKWTQVRATPAQVALWAEEPDYGICIQTRRVRALDVDVDDAYRASEIRRLVYQYLGFLPARTRANSFRVLLVFELEDDAGLAKRVIKFDDRGLIELLADGQQFVAAGTHVSGGRYVWDQGLPDAVPRVSRAALEALWQALGGKGHDVQASAGGRQGGAQRAEIGASGVKGGAPDPVGEWLLEADKTVGSGRDGALWILCPWAAEHSADSGPSQTVWFPPSTGGYAQGHFKCLHAHCAERTDEDFLDAIGFRESFAADFAPADNASESVGESHSTNQTEAPSGFHHVPLSAPAAKQADNTPGVGFRSILQAAGLRRDGRRRFLAELPNLVQALMTQDAIARVGFDEFRCELSWCHWDEPLGGERWQSVNTRFLIDCRHRLQQAGFSPISRELIRDAVEHCGALNRFDSAKYWLGCQTWDGVPRIAGFLANYCRAADSPYARAVSEYLWTALAGRVLEPGVKADMVPIFVGAQGMRKSWGIESLSPLPDAYVTIDLAHRDDQLARRMRGRLVWEIAELRGLGSRDAEGIKTFLAERADTWRPVYEEFPVTVPRRGLFFGTSNTDEILSDSTGNRRWLPIRVGAIDRERIEADRSQLWAEAAALFELGGVRWAAAESLGSDEHEAFAIYDSWTENVEAWIAKKQADNGPTWQGWTTNEAALGIGLDPRQINRGMEMRFSAIFKSMGFEQVRQTRMLGNRSVRKRIWIRRLLA